MALWTFRDYKDQSGNNVIADWVGSIEPPKKRNKVIARWDAILEQLQNLEQPVWPRDWFTQLAGFPGIFEMKFTVQNIQWRPLGFFGPRRYEFTFLIGAIERNDRFHPRDAPSLALKRKGDVEADYNRAEEHNLPVDE